MFKKYLCAGLAAFLLIAETPVTAYAQEENALQALVEGIAPEEVVADESIGEALEIEDSDMTVGEAVEMEEPTIGEVTEEVPAEDTEAGVEEVVEAEAFAADGVTSGYVTGTEDAVRWTYDPATKTTTITGKGTRGYSGGLNLGCPADTEYIVFVDCEIQGSMMSFFEGLKKLKAIDFSGLKEGNAIDYMDSMFYQCESLEEIDMSRFDTSKVSSMKWAFRDCKNLKKINLTNFDTSKVYDMSWMFQFCENLTELDVSGFDTSNAQLMSAMFDGCKSLEVLDVSGFDTSNARHMAGMFSNCESLKELDLSNFDISGITESGLSGMFRGCSSLTELDLSSFDTSNITTLFDTFQYCSSLKKLDLSNFDTSNVTDMWSTFDGCSSLTELDISNFDTSKVTNMDGMFKNCSSLTTLDVSNFDTSNVTKMVWMFSGCENLTELNISNFDTSKVTEMWSMFQNCSSLTQLDMSNFSTDSTTKMAKMFSGCTNLKSLDLSNFNTSNVEEMPAMFYMCTSLESLDLSNFDTANVVGETGYMLDETNWIDWISVSGMEYMFAGCNNLKELNLSGFDMSNLKKYENMFLDCKSLQTLNTPKALGTVTVALPGNYVNPSGKATAQLKAGFENTVLTKELVAPPTINKQGDKLVVNALAGSVLYYTTDGSTPTIEKGIKVNGNTLSVDSFSGHLKVIAVKDGVVSSMTKLTMFKPEKERNVSFKAAGVFGGRNVTFNSELEGAKIYYSSTTSTLSLKDKCVNVGDTVLFENFYGTVYARTYKDGVWGNVCRFVLRIPVVKTPTIVVDSKGYATIRTQTPASHLFYTLDGTTPSMKNGKRVFSPYARVYVGKGKTIKAIAVRSCFTHSDVATKKN